MIKMDVNKVDLEIFNLFLSMAMKRMGDKDKLMEFLRKTGVDQADQVDLLNRMMTIFMDIPEGIFPDASVRIKLLSDYRGFIEEFTMQQEFDQTYTHDTEEPSFDDLIDMFDLD